MKRILPVIIALCIALPYTADAYLTTGQQAYKVNDTTALYYITYTFGHRDYDMYLPVFANRGQKWGSPSNTIGFDILEDNDFAAHDGTAQAIALANLPIIDGMYKITKGSKASFTLAVIFTVDSTLDAANYSVLVQDLPFYLDINGTRQREQLNPSELQYYATDPITLNGTSIQDVVNSISIDVTSVEYSSAK